MQYIVNGANVTLTQNNYVAQGGEGQLFQKGKLAYKICFDGKMIPVAKVGELKELRSPNIVSPIDVIYTKDKKPVGFTMNWLGEKNYPLCKLFTNTFRDANGITNDHIIQLVENIKKVIISPIHERRCLIVDGNEFNYLVGTDFVTPYFIDVNSWKTKSFPPTAIMPSIRDWTATEFTELTDWFSFAIVSFQLFVGIHPFKGKHKDFKKGSFEERVKSNISILNKDVKYPPSVRDFGLIPKDYYDWYYRLFEKGERCLPPKMPGKIGTIQVQTIIVTSTDNFEITEIKEYDDIIVYHNENVTKTKKLLYINSTDYKVRPDVEVIFSPFKNIEIFCKIEDGKLQLMSPTKTEVDQINIQCTEKMIIDNTLYLKNRGQLIELRINDFGRIIFSVNQVWNITEKSSKLYSGIVCQSVLGKAYICIPLPDYKTSSFIIKDIPELDKQKIVDAKHENHVCMFITTDGGVYNRYVIVFNDDYTSYIIREFLDVDYTPLNYIVLDNGICINIREDNVVEVFHNRHPEKIKEIKDSKVDSTMRLCKKGMGVRFFKGNKLFGFQIKK